MGLEAKMMVFVASPKKEINYWLKCHFWILVIQNLLNRLFCRLQRLPFQRQSDESLPYEEHADYGQSEAENCEKSREDIDEQRSDDEKQTNGGEDQEEGSVGASTSFAARNDSDGFDEKWPIRFPLGVHSGRRKAVIDSETGP